MKKILLLFTLFFSVFAFNSCKKSGTALPPSNQAACQLQSQSVSPSGNYINYVYNTDGRISDIKYFSARGVLQDSVLVGDYTLQKHHFDYPIANNPRKINTSVFTGSMFDALPLSEEHAFLEGAITHTNINKFYFDYDSKNRLIKLTQQTENVISDKEYFLFISYDDKDNVTSLKYEISTGVHSTTTIVGSGYDDMPNPYSAIKAARFLFNSGWGSNDPAYIFIALSKNNPLGYTMADGFKRSMTYTYNGKGFPLKRINTNTNAAGTSTYTFEETYDYQCK